VALLVPFRPWLNFGNLGVGGSRRKVAEPLPPDYLLRSSQRVCSLVSHVRLGFQQRCLSRSLIVCRDLQGCSQGAVYVSLNVWDEIEDMTEALRKMQEESSHTEESDEEEDS